MGGTSVVALILLAGVACGYVTWRWCQEEVRLARDLQQDAEADLQAQVDLSRYLYAALGDDPTAMERRLAIRAKVEGQREAR